MLTKDFELTNQGGLHARPATFFVKLCSNFKSNIKVVMNSRQADAKSLISVMALGAGKGKTVTIMVEGEDEKLVLEKISDYFSHLE